MKYIFYLIVMVTISTKSFCQGNDSLMVTNKNNFEKSFLYHRVNESKNKEIILDVKLMEQGKYLFTSEEERKACGYKDDYTTGIGFVITGYADRYYYPIHKNYIEKFSDLNINNFKDAKLKLSIHYCNDKLIISILNIMG